MAAITNLITAWVSHPPTPSSPAVPLSKMFDERQPALEKCELRIEGMTCGACVESIEGVLRTQPGIASVQIALLAERGVVEYDPQIWSVDKIVSEIEDVGFDATHIPQSRSDAVTLRVYGMTCSACTNSIESGLIAVPGVNSVAVSLTAQSAKVEYDRTVVGLRELIEHISDMGFDAMLSDEEDATQIRSLMRTKEIHEWRDRLKRSVAFAIPVFFISMVIPHISFLRPIVNAKIFRGIYVGDVLSLLLTTPAQFWVGSKFYRNAYKSLRHGVATMDVLITLGTTAAFLYSISSMILAPFNSDPDFKPSVFFDTSTMLIMFVSLGRYLENKAKGKTSAALTDLMALSPGMATIYTDAPTCSQEKKVATELLQVGDIVKIVPGDKIPADGTVVRGTSSIDESMITGEPIPLLKQVGDTVIGGTVNGLGTFDMEVTRAGKETALAQIVKLVEEAQTSKAPIQAFADKVAGYFVPTVISLALITFIAWMVLSNIVPENSLPDIFHHHGASKLSVCLKLCISVVVVACPCALGLSTPTAIMVGTGVGANNGILIKGGQALEASKSIKRIVFDKTGTVTEGKLTVSSLCWVPHDSADGQHSPNTSLTQITADGITSRATLLSIVGVVEARSEHPLAKAVATYGKDLISSSKLDAPGITVRSFESVPGAGVKATVSVAGSSFPQTVYIGSARFTSQTEDPNLHPSLSTFEANECSTGRTVIFVSTSIAPARPRVMLALSLLDRPKPSSRQAIQALMDMGIEVNMMTGDGRITALAVAKEVGIPAEGVWASMSPKGKARVVAELMEKNAGGVAMVGDGINDSPALVAADVGIALSSGTSVAIEAADIILMRSDLLDVVAALHLSRSIYSVIKRNLIWACIYNIFGIPLAMGFFLPLGIHLHPMMAGAAMALSSVSVVTSSLTLKWWKRPKESVMDGEPIVGEDMISSLKKEAADAWSNIRQTFIKRDRDGYTQLPVEMSAA